MLPRSIAAALAAALLTTASAPPAAEAVLALPKGQLPRTAEIALRRSIPAFNREVKDVQDKLEVCDQPTYLTSCKEYDTMPLLANDAHSCLCWPFSCSWVSRHH